MPTDQDFPCAFCRNGKPWKRILRPDSSCEKETKKQKKQDPVHIRHNESFKKMF
jgi:hypothetical protein